MNNDSYISPYARGGDDSDKKREPMTLSTRTMYAIAMIIILATLALGIFGPRAHAATLNDLLAQQANAGCPSISAKGIPVIGCTGDKKYPVYKIEGDVDADWWIVNGKKYTSDWIMKNMQPIAKSDFSNNDFERGYKCYVTCQDRRGNTVGVNPMMVGH